MIAKRTLYPILIISTLLISINVAFAAEPENLSTAKKNVTDYVASGEYEADIQAAVDKAQATLEKAVEDNTKSDKPAKLAIVLDIDETSLSNYPTMLTLDFGGSQKTIQAYQNAGLDLPITPTLNFYRYAEAHNVAVFFVTGRPDNERNGTEQNLKHAGYFHWNDIMFRTGEYQDLPVAKYKTAMREAIEKIGYVIVVNLGDQKSDLDGGHAQHAYKLPNPFYSVP